MVFSTLPQPWILFTFLLLSVLDSFSQIFGQLLGKTHILKKISPGKTLEGFLGGAATTLVTSLLLHSLMAFPARRAPARCRNSRLGFSG